MVAKGVGQPWALYTLDKFISGVSAMKKMIVVCLAVLLALGTALPGYCGDTITCWFPPSWKSKPDKAMKIAQTLSQESTLQIKPRIAKSYPEILKAFSSNQESLVYVGSFVQAIIKARKLGTPLIQSVNGKEMYSGVLVYPKGENPVAILEKSPAEIAYAVGASSGESSAKAATGGKASMGVPNHGAACAAVTAGKAKAGVVKNWWWEANKDKFPGLEIYEIPGISIMKNPDNILSASKSISPDIMLKVTAAAFDSREVFGVQRMVPFNSARLDFSLDLMKRGNIDPLTYTW